MPSNAVVEAFDGLKDGLPGHRKTVLDKTARPLKKTKLGVPLDILISLLRPDELEKLQKYIASYLERH